MIAARDGDAGYDDGGNDDDGADDRMPTGDSNVALFSASQGAERQAPQQVQASAHPYIAEAPDSRVEASSGDGDGEDASIIEMGNCPSGAVVSAENAEGRRRKNNDT
jgi:hypothetical protein